MGTQGSLKYYENRDPDPHFSMKMGTRGPQFGGSLFSYDTGTKVILMTYLLLLLQKPLSVCSYSYVLGMRTDQSSKYIMYLQQCHNYQAPITQCHDQQLVARAIVMCMGGSSRIKIAVTTKLATCICVQLYFILQCHDRCSDSKQLANYSRCCHARSKQSKVAKPSLSILAVRYQRIASCYTTIPQNAITK